MSEVQNNLGEKFKETIAKAMKTGDFHALNTLVTDTVNDALAGGGFSGESVQGSHGKKVWNSQRSWQDKRRKKSRPRQRSRQNAKNGKTAGGAPQAERRMAQTARRTGKKQWEKQWEEQRKAQAEQNRARNQAGVWTPRKTTALEMTSLVKMEKKGNVSGTLCTVFGGIGLGFSGLGLWYSCYWQLFRQHL